MLSAQSQLLERNLDLFEQGDWLVINPADAYFADLVSHRQMDFLHQYFDIFAESARVIQSHTFDSRDIVSHATGFALEQQVSRHRHIFAPFIDASRSYSHVVIYLPKAKAHLAMLLNLAASVLQPGGQLMVVGENKGGIKSAGKLAEKYGLTNKVDSARHCSLLCTQVAEPVAFDINQYLDTRTYHTDSNEWDVVSLPGVFSHTELDTGTRLLLDKLPSSLAGHVLDFACGAGVIAASLLKQYPHLNLTLLDVSALALYSAAHTLAENEQQASLVAANGLHGVDAKFDVIVTNPPFHTGIKTDYTITKRFISDAKRSLAGRGGMHMVANRFLPYPGLLGEHFNQVRTIAQTSQFSVYHALP